MKQLMLRVEEIQMDNLSQDDESKALKNIPEPCMNLVTTIIKNARSKMEDGIALPASVFIGRLDSKIAHCLYMNTENQEEKFYSSLAIKAFADSHNADFIFWLAEAWKNVEDNESMSGKESSKTGGSAASANPEDLVVMMFESMHGTVGAFLPIEPKGDSAKRRTFGIPEFEPVESGGNLANILSGKDAKKTSSVLH